MHQFHDNREQQNNEAARKDERDQGKQQFHRRLHGKRFGAQEALGAALVRLRPQYRPELGKTLDARR